MKRCPYCAEEIQEEAKKCKHCGEWLNGTQNPIESTAKDVFNKTASFLKEQKEKYQERKTAHLYIPTDEKPMELNGAVFYGDHLVFNNKNYRYSDVVSIKYFAMAQTTNLMTSNTENKFLIYFNTEENFPLENRKKKNVIDISTSSFLGIGSGKKTRDQFGLISKFLKKVTFQNRLNLYLNQLIKQGFFYFTCQYSSSLKIYNNGDIQKDGEVRVNIFEAFKNNNIDHGLYMENWNRRNTYSDPYLFTVHHSKSRGFFSSKTEIELHYDKDVFHSLFNQLITTGSFLPNEFLNRLGAELYAKGRVN